MKSIFALALLGTAALAENTPSPAPTPAPDAPASIPESAPAKPAIKSLGGSRYELGGISFHETTRAISLPAVVNMTEGLLEYAIVHEAGKVHESFLSTTISPYDLNVVLLLLHYQPATTFFDLSDKKAGAILLNNPQITPSAQIAVSLEWKNPEGKTQTAPLESLLLNVDQKATVTPGPFTYTGSMVMDDGTFMAKETGSILALYADAASLLNNPRPGNENDDTWLPDKTKTPAKGTPVTVTLTPYKNDKGQKDK